jgi:cysteine desulfurase/selenocysteine lyase
MRAAIQKAIPRLDPEKVKGDFPILRQRIHGHPLVYLDSAATSQKPQSVIDTISHFYLSDNSNVHRGVHQLSERATQAFEAAREKVQRFINAAKSEEVVFVRGTTEAINLVAQTFGRVNVGAGDQVLISAMEHHSNIVPWQILCEQKGASLRVLPINDAGELSVEEFESQLGPRTRLVALAHVSNALGTVNPVRKLIEIAHRRSVPVLVDGAQAVPHLKVDVRALDCDFYAFSSHKMFGPMGIGVLYAKSRWLDAMPPYQGGGDMILSVTFEKTVYNRIPYKFEAGTPDVAGAIGLGAAIDYLEGLGLDAIAAYEHDLLQYGTESLQSVEGLRLIGTAREKASVLSFVVENIHPHDLGTILDHEGIAVRTGHHCAQPVMQRFGVPATARASLALYNTPEDIDRLVAGIRRAKEVFQ